MKRTSRRQLLKELLAAPLPELPRGARRQLIRQMADRIQTYWRFREGTVATPKNMRASLRRLSESTSALKKHIGQLPASTKRDIARVPGRHRADGPLLEGVTLPPGLARGTVLVAAVEYLLTRFDQWVPRRSRRPAFRGQQAARFIRAAPLRSNAAASTCRHSIQSTPGAARHAIL
jgi:hypothetical protein